MNKKSRKINSTRNMFFGITNQVVMLILNFVSRTIFIKTLGSEYLGINGLFSNILTMLSLTELGVGSAMLYGLYKPIANNDEIKISQLMNYFKKLYNWVAVVVTIVGIIIVPFLNIIINTESNIQNLKLYYILFLANSVISYVFIYKSSLINANQENYLISLITLLGNIVKLMAQIIVLILTHNYIMYLLIQILATFFTNVYIAHKADKKYPFIKQNKETLPKEESKEIWINIKSMFLYKLSSVLITGTDNILISMLIGTIWVGYYSNYYMIIGAISGFITVIFRSLYGSIGNLVVKENKEKRNEIFNVILFLGMWISTITTACMYLLINDFIVLWLGEPYLLDIKTVFAITLNYYLFCALNPIWSFREATGMFRRTKYVMLITALLNLILSIVFGIYMGMFGIIIASAIARLLTYFWYEPIIMYKDYFNEPVKKYFLKQFKNAVITFVNILLIIYFITLLQPINISNFILKILICILASNILFLICYYKTKEFRYVLDLIKAILKPINKTKIKNS